MISSMPAAIRKLPHKNVFGCKIRSALTRVITPLIITPVLLKCHLLNSVNISVFPAAIAQPCLRPMKTATNISTLLTTFEIITNSFKFYQINIPPDASMRCALTHLASSLHRKATTLPISSALPTRPSAV